MDVFLVDEFIVQAYFELAEGDITRSTEHDDGRVVSGFYIEAVERV